jgi:NAD+ synthase
MDTQSRPTFTRNILVIPDIDFVCEQLITRLRLQITDTLNRQGAVVGISGGIDSALTLALAVRALGSERVLGIMLPEKESSSQSAKYAELLALKFGVRTLTEDITGALEGYGCYQRRDEAVKQVIPEYNPKHHRMKIGIKSSGIFGNLPPLFYVTILDAENREITRRLPAKEFRQIEAASNFKQRCRMSMLYYHAERLHYAVIGTPNKHEMEQGFFVKYGDGGADIMPIAHLFKTQVYQVAEYLQVPREIIERVPTTDTYSAEQTQEEFFYQLPFVEMDLLWFAYENGYSESEVAPEVGMTEEQVKSIFMNFKRKQKTTAYLRMAPVKDVFID